MHSATKVVTTWSTMAIEAAYAGQPAILLDRATFEDVGATYNPADHTEAVEMIMADLPAKPKDRALKYGHFMATFGTPYQRVTLKSVNKASINGIRVRSSWHLDWLHKLVKRMGGMRKPVEVIRDQDR
jgi:hypothetical protein